MSKRSIGFDPDNPAVQQATSTRLGVEGGVVIYKTTPQIALFHVDDNQALLRLLVGAYNLLEDMGAGEADLMVVRRLAMDYRTPPDSL